MRGEHPTDEAWRADALAQSRHSRLVDELRAPADEVDEATAERICGEVTRAALRDFAPALILLPAAERRRVQALAAWTLVLFDFARQSGLEGERLTQLNRMEFELEQALEGAPRGQPALLLMAREEERRPWPREALDAILAAARRRVVEPQPADRAAAEADAAHLGEALAGALVPAPRPAVGLDESVAVPGAGLAAALVRLHGLLGLGEGLRRHRPRLGRDRLPDDRLDGWRERRGELDASVREEAAALQAKMRGGTMPLPADYRRAATYARLAARRLLTAVERLGSEVIEHPPRLGAWTRIALLVRARILGGR